nr:MAG TPA: hypothetical protein [Caudoviricetes sp.]
MRQHAKFLPLLFSVRKYGRTDRKTTSVHRSRRCFGHARL